jgi:hypothetical protein
MKKIFALPLIVLLTVSCAELQDMANQVGTTTGTPLSNADVVAGLKQALEKGAEHSVDVASVADGFWKNPRLRIPFPPEAEKMKNTLNDIGMSSQVDKFELTMNRAAEAAAKEAVPVFVNAIKGMTVADGFAILRGGDNAATNFLKEKTTPELIAKFQPIVVKSHTRSRANELLDAIGRSLQQDHLVHRRPSHQSRPRCLRDTKSDRRPVPSGSR